MATGWPRAARVAVASCVLSPNSAIAIVIAIEAIADDVRTMRAVSSVGAFAERQDGEHQEHDAAADRQRPVGQGRAEQAADDGGDGAGGREAERETDQRRPGAGSAPRS